MEEGGALALRMARIGAQLAELREMLGANAQRLGAQQARAAAEIAGLRAKLLDALAPDALQRGERLARLSRRLDHLERGVGREQAECVRVLEALLAAVERSRATADTMCQQPLAAAWTSNHAVWTAAASPAVAASAWAASPAAGRPAASPVAAWRGAGDTDLGLLLGFAEDEAPVRPQPQVLTLPEIGEQAAIMLQNMKEMLRLREAGPPPPPDGGAPGAADEAPGAPLPPAAVGLVEQPELHAYVQGSWRQHASVEGQNTASAASIGAAADSASDAGAATSIRPSADDSGAGCAEDPTRWLGSACSENASSVGSSQ